VPELPEVETIVRDVARQLPGRSIVGVEIVHPDLLEHGSPDAFAAPLTGATVLGVSRRAKNIVVALDQLRLVINLGMTGRLLVLGPDDHPPSHPGVRFALDDGRVLAYHDVRRFGRLALYSLDAWTDRAARLGVEPLDPHFTPALLHDLASYSRMAIKSWLMDQRRVVGLGNIYASEALFRARISPRRAAASLKRPEAARLHSAILDVLREAIEFRGTTLLDYRDADGNPGGFAERLRVYDRADEPCSRCGRPITRIVQGGRSTFFCRSCQR
jgi:formamidopyrimidine-DNA glycosylase